MAELCSPEELCPSCESPCQKQKGHEGQHECINCETKWRDEEGETMTCEHLELKKCGESL